MSNSLVQSAENMNAKLRSQTSQSLAVQNYCQSVIIQPTIDFGDIQKLKSLQEDINKGLATAKENANYYLGTLQPQIITNLTNIDNYFALQSSIPATLPEGSSKEEWLNMLGAVRDQSNKYQQVAADTASDLGTFYVRLSNDTTHFNEYANKLNTLVEGDQGILAQMDKDLGKIDGKIAGAITGAVLSGLAIAGGAFLVVVGTVSTFVTAGTSAKIAVAGGLVIAAGAAGAAGSTVALINLYKQRNTIIQQQTQLNAEVRAVSAVAGNYDLLYKQAGEALTATKQMESAWQILSGDLEHLADNLQNGITSPDQMRTLFLTTADKTLVTVKQDINTIKAQMTGVDIKTAPAGEDLMEYAGRLARA